MNVIVTLLSTVSMASVAPSQIAPALSSYTAPSSFPTSAFSSYYLPPAPTQEPQPALFDPILNFTFPLNLTDPNTIPEEDDDLVVYPPPQQAGDNATLAIENAVKKIQNIISGGAGISGNCSRCQAALAAGQEATRAAPGLVPDAMVALCKATKFASNATCEEDYAAGSFGAIWTQVLYYADVTGLDGRYICNSLSGSFCSLPYASPLDTSKLFPKPKPANAHAPKPSGNRAKVLHLSDWYFNPTISRTSFVTYNF